MSSFFANKGVSIRNSLQSMKDHLNAAHKKKLMFLCFLIFSSAVLDVFGLAVILPVITAAAKPELIHSTPALELIYTALNFSSERFFLLFLILVLLGFFILKSAFGLFVTFRQAKISSEIAIYLSKHQLSKFFSLNFSDFQSLNTAVITKDVVANSNSYVQFIVLSLITLFSELMIVLLIIAAIAAFNLQMFAFIILTLGPATFIISKIIRKKSSGIGVAIDINYPLALGAVSQALNGFVDIKLADKENYYRDKFLSYQHRFQWQTMKYYFMNQVPFRTNEIIALMGIIVIFVYSLFLSSNETEIITLIGLFAAAAYRLMPSMNRIINALNFININQVSIHNLNHHFAHYRKERGKKKNQVSLDFKNEISFRDMSFHFPGARMPVLKNINFTVKKGDKVGFIGSSGSGKTTLMNLLLRLYIENEGGIWVDGVKLTEENVISWRKKLGYVKQDIFLLDGTIQENVTFGEDVADEKQLNTALRQACLTDLVNALPEGVNSMVGEKGSRLSGGQRQRIGIARSLYRNAEVLIFDEATSALDMETENEVTEAIDALSATNKTIFIIAHRVTTLKNCDRIYELSNGEISGIHTYHDLIEKVF